MNIQSEFVAITPELANEYLTKNTRNRNLSRAMVNRIKDDIEHNRWETTHQGVAFYETGELADGQTRLTAIKESGKSVMMFVTTGIPVTAGAAIDRHRARSDADSIKIGGLSNWIGKEQISLIKMIALAHMKHSPSYSAAHIAELGEFLKDQVTFALLAFSSKKTHITTSPVMAAVAIARPYLDEYRLLEFAEVLLTGMPVSNDAMDDAGAIRLRDQLIEDRGRGGQAERRETLLKTQRALKAFADRDHIQKLYTPKELIYRVEGIETHL